VNDQQVEFGLEIEIVNKAIGVMESTLKWTMLGHPSTFPMSRLFRHYFLLVIVLTATIHARESRGDRCCEYGHWKVDCEEKDLEKKTEKYQKGMHQMRLLGNELGDCSEFYVKIFAE